MFTDKAFEVPKIYNFLGSKSSKICYEVLDMTLSANNGGTTSSAQGFEKWFDREAVLEEFECSSYLS